MVLFADGGLVGDAGGRWGTLGTGRGREGQQDPKQRGDPEWGKSRGYQEGDPEFLGWEGGGRKGHTGSFGESRARSWLEKGCERWGAEVGGGRVEREGMALAWWPERVSPKKTKAEKSL